MFGDVLKQKLRDGLFLKTIDTKKNVEGAFWLVLRNTAIEDLKEYAPQAIDSNNAVAIYYDILSENMEFLPTFACEVLPSNKQERFRVINRNMFTSNAFHKEGIANQPNISPTVENNDDRKGARIKYVYKKDNCL